MSEPHVVVAGAGIAGLASAVALARDGHRVTLIERRPRCGGRTHALPATQLGDVVDNGQHLMLAGYRSTRAFLRVIGTEQRVHFDDSIATLFRDPHTGPTWLRGPTLPGPLARLGPLIALLRLRNVPWRDKLALGDCFRALLELRRGVPPALDAITADAWLSRLRVPASVRRAFFDPLIVSTLNERPDRVSAHAFAALLRWGFLSDPTAGRLGYPTVDLDALFVAPSLRVLAACGATAITGRAAKRLELAGGRVHHLELDDGSRLEADAYLLALPPHAVAKVVAASGLADDPFFARAQHIEVAPLLSVNYWLDRPLGTAHPFEGLLDCPIEWVFDRQKMSGRTGEGYYYTLIVSASWSLIEQTQAAILAAAWRSLVMHYPAVSAARVLHSSVVKHPHATFSARPGFEALRCTQRTPIANLFLAGDWTDTGLPSTMESAAASAERAVAAIAESVRPT